MRKLLGSAVLLLLLSLLSIPVHAQTKVKLKATPHSVTLTWNVALTGATYNVNRATCTGTITAGVCSVVPAQSAFTTVNTTAANVVTYTDLAVTQGQQLVYDITATCVAPACGIDSATGGVYSGTSSPSVMVAALIPTPAPVVPPAPANLTLTNVQ